MTAVSGDLLAAQHEGLPRIHAQTINFRVMARGIVIGDEDEIQTYSACAGN